MYDPIVLFEAAFLRRAQQLAIRAETDDDQAFLQKLFAACFPLANVMPEALLAMQAHAQYQSHLTAYPGAMRRIVSEGEQPIGRIMVDWGANGLSHGVDIAVLPEARNSMAGLHLLRAWLDAADRCGFACSLEVLANNPARRIYARLGFRADESRDDAAVVRMTRPRPG
jgi:ribosomal protein S18 acetylase RimI-like enzyme